MNDRKFTTIVSLPKEKIVSMVSFGGGDYWDWKFPFRHYRTTSYIVATENGIYKLEIN